jgi:hypothetical protein
MRWLQLVPLLLILTGCVGTSDRLTPIEGHIVSADGRSLRGCWLEARSASTGEAIKGTREQIDGQSSDGHFRTGFVNSPSSGRYFIAIDCGPTLTSYRSSEYDFAISKPIDLGQIVLNPR